MCDSDLSIDRLYIPSLGLIEYSAFAGANSHSRSRYVFLFQMTRKFIPPRENNMDYFKKMASDYAKQVIGVR